MNDNLEWIEKEIGYWWSKYEFHKNQPITDFNNVAMNLCIDKLNHLQRIKSILEAWEVVKKYTDTSDDIVNTEFYLYIDFKSDIEDFKIMKKALEVKDE